MGHNNLNNIESNTGYLLAIISSGFIGTGNFSPGH
jgi:hypothetical protein